MLVSHLIPRFPYFGENSIIGGAANTLYNLVKQQSGKIDYQIFAQIPGENFDIRSGYRSLNIIPLKIKAPPTSLLFGFSYTCQIVLDALRKNLPCNLVHGHSGYLDYLISTAVFAAIRKIPAVYSVYCPVITKNVYRSIFQKIIVRIADPFIHTYIAISENVAHSLREVGISAQKIRVIHPIVDLVRFNPNIDKGMAKKKLGLNNHDALILFVGSTKPVKNLETTLRAFSLVIKEMPNACLMITTELTHKDHNERSAYLENLIEKLGLSKKILQFGIVENMPELMASANVFVAPFLDTNGPSDYFQAALEAMAVGKPVVVSAVGAMPEVVDNEVGYLINPADVSQIAAALLMALRNNDQSLRQGIAASSRIRDQFNPTKISKSISDLYFEIIGGNPN